MEAYNKNELSKLEYDSGDFWCRIDLGENHERNKRVQARLFGIDCNYMTLQYIKSCCQTFLHFQGFANAKFINTEDGSVLQFAIRQKNKKRYFHILANPKVKNDDLIEKIYSSKETYYDYQDVSMLDAVLATCLRYMLYRH